MREELIATIFNFKYLWSVPTPFLCMYTAPRLQVDSQKGHSQVKTLVVNKSSVLEHISHNS